LGVSLRIGLLRGAFRAPLRLSRLLEGEGGTRGVAAHEQIRAASAAGAGAIHFGKERAARIRSDRGDRSGARTEAKPMQRERGLSFGIKGHASRSSPLDATSPPVMVASP
jgi:hypothetical protein